MPITTDQRARERGIAAHLVGLGYDLANSRIHPDGWVEVFLGPAATAQQRADAQAAADAWTPSAADRVKAAARARGLSVPQLAALRAIAARVAGTAVPAWAAAVLAAAASEIDQELS